MRASAIGVFLAAMSGLPLALAQNADKPGESKVPPAPAPGAGDKQAAAPVTDGKSALAAAAKAMADAKWISYQAKVEGVGMNGDYTATVTLERAEAGGWKVAVKGERPGHQVRDVGIGTAELKDALESDDPKIVIIPEGTACEYYRLEHPGAVVVETDIGAASLIAQQAPTALRPDNPRGLKITAPAEPKRVRDAVQNDLDVLFSRGNDNRPATGHGVARIDSQIQDRQFELIRVG